MEEGAVMLVGLDWRRIREGVWFLKRRKHGDEGTLHAVDDYNVPNVSEKMTGIIPQLHRLCESHRFAKEPEVSKRVNVRVFVVSELYYPEETSTGFIMTRIAE